jgi:phosphate transport system permease protein
LSTTTPPTDLALALRGSARRRTREAGISAAFLLAALTSVAISVAIVLTLVFEAWSFIEKIDLTQLTDIGWFPRRGSFDLSTLFAGSLLVALIAMLVATPLGLGAAIYLSEYAKPRTRRMLKPILEVLASIPSVVLGFFALRAISPDFVDHIANWFAFPRLAPGDRDAERYALWAFLALLVALAVLVLGPKRTDRARTATFAVGGVLGVLMVVLVILSVTSGGGDGAAGFNMAAAGVGVGILTIPLVASVAEDAMRAVPHSLREASYGLGARPMTTSTRVVFPAAISGIVAALILAISRAIGETLVVAIAAGGSGNVLYSTDVTGQGMTITAAIASLSFGSDAIAGDDAAFQSLYFLGLLLFVITFALNALGGAFVRRTRQQY